MDGNRWLNKYLRIAMEEKGGYDARARDFDDYEVIVAESDQRIVGVINVGIKPVALDGGKTGVGFLYGLRVHEAVQGAGMYRQ